MMNGRNFMPMHSGGMGGMGMGMGRMPFNPGGMAQGMPQPQPVFGVQPPVNIGGQQFGGNGQPAPGTPVRGIGQGYASMPPQFNPQQGPPPQLGSLGQAMLQLQQQRGMQPQPQPMMANPNSMPQMR